jgi:FkbM family methyltransferase
MFHYIKRYLRTVGILGLLRALGEKTTGSTGLFSLNRKGIAFPIYLRLNSSDVPTYEDLSTNRDNDFSVLQPPTTTVDAGANIGLAAIHFANRWPDAGIIAIEPETSNFNLLKKNVAPYGNVHPVNAALWNRTGEIDMIDTGFGYWAFMTQAPDASMPPKGQPAPKIRAITMDAVIDEFRLDKIDIL